MLRWPVGPLTRGPVGPLARWPVSPLTRWPVGRLVTVISRPVAASFGHLFRSAEQHSWVSLRLSLSFQLWAFNFQLSSHPASSIQYPGYSGVFNLSTLNLQLSALSSSSIQHPASSIQHPESSIQNQASRIKHPEPTSIYPGSGSRFFQPSGPSTTFRNVHVSIGTPSKTEDR